jgi:glutamine amidotransferase
LIAIVDVGLGNLRSVEKALAHVGGRARVTADPDEVLAAERIVVPGQGAFGDCARALEPGAPLGRALTRAIADGRPYLGICLGLQALFAASEEAPGARGLGLLEGEVVRLPGDLTDQRGARCKVPHMGWNTVAPARPHPLLPEAPTPFYFVHSFHAAPRAPEMVAARCEYGGREVVAAVARGNLFAVQFHPEKSQRAGLELLARFVAWTP